MVLIFSAPGIFAPLASPPNKKKSSSRPGSEPARSRSMSRRARLRDRRRFITTPVYMPQGPTIRDRRWRWDDRSREPPYPWITAEPRRSAVPCRPRRQRCRASPHARVPPCPAASPEWGERHQPPCAAAGLRLAGLGPAIVGGVIDYSHRPLGAGVLTPPERPRRSASATPRRWHRRGPGEMQVVMTELSDVRVTRLAADPRGFCALLGRF
jgi:hypothetical protein